MSTPYRLDEGEEEPVSPIDGTDTGHSETEVLPDPDVGPINVPGLSGNPVRCQFAFMSFCIIFLAS